MHILFIVFAFLPFYLGVFNQLLIFSVIGVSDIATSCE